MGQMQNCVCLLTVVITFFCGCCHNSGLGPCPRFEYMKNFNVTKLAGRWYEIERSFYLMELTTSCTTVNLELNNRGQFVATISSISSWTGSKIINEGIATPSRRDPSLLQYRVSTFLPNAVARHLPMAGVYQILDTDYDNFAIVYTCTNLGLVHTDYVWIFGRGTEIDVTLRAEIYEFLARKRIDSERLIIPKNCTTVEMRLCKRESEHKGCFYLAGVYTKGSAINFLVSGPKGWDITLYRQCFVKIILGL